jgi:hypothetical protein
MPKHYKKKRRSYKKKGLIEKNVVLKGLHQSRKALDFLIDK